MNEQSFQTIRAMVRWMFRVVAMAAVVTFIYGIAEYPDAPISTRDGKFFGKQGQPHTYLEFEAFSNWERTLEILWTAMFIMFTLRYYVEPEWRKQTGTWKDF